MNPREWNDWRWQLAAATQNDGLWAPLPAVEKLFPAIATPYYRSLVDPSDPSDPIRRMIVPSDEELYAVDATTDDPIREESHSPVPGLVRRYPDRALVLVHGACAVHCRHCTRRILGRGNVAPVDGRELDDALEFIARTPEIRDVILSGGDPLLLEDEALCDIVRKVREIPSVDVIRIATRAPVALPMRVTGALARSLAAFGPLYVNTQFNHPRELSAEAIAAVGQFVDAGIPVSNQSVLLAGVNDDVAVMEALLRKLLVARVRPYYLFACDLVAGTEHFRVPLSDAFEIMGRLRGRISGLAIPTFVVDLPGGYGKIPVEPSYVTPARPGFWTLRAPTGELVEYPDASRAPRTSRGG